MNFDQNVEFTLGDETEKSTKKELSSAELTKQLERLIQDQADNQRIFDWVEVCAHEAKAKALMGQGGHENRNNLFSCLQANLDEQQMSSNMFVRALMTCVCRSAIVCKSLRLKPKCISVRARALDVCVQKPH